MTATCRELTIDAELEDYLPGVPTETDEALDASLVRTGGPIDAIIVWKDKDIIVDGHRRYRACKRLGLPYDVREREFLNINAVKAFMDEFQASRRNMTDAQRAHVIARILRREFDTGGRGAHQRVADKFGITTRTVVRHQHVGEAIEKLPEDIRKLIDTGKLKPTHGEVLALAELPEMHQRRVLAEYDNGKGAHKTLWAAIRGDDELEPTEDDESPQEAAGERRSGSGGKSSRAKGDTMSPKSKEPVLDEEFFKRAYEHLGRLDAHIAQHQHLAVGAFNRIQGLCDKIEKTLKEVQTDGE